MSATGTGASQVTNDDIARIIASHDSDIKIQSQQIEQLQNFTSEGFKKLEKHFDNAIQTIDQRIERRESGRPSILQWLAGGAAMATVLGGIFLFTYFFTQMQVGLSQKTLVNSALKRESALTNRIVKIECAILLDADCRGHSSRGKGPSTR